MHTPHPASTASAPWPSASRGWMVAGLLALTSMASQADRTVVTLMAGPIKAQFGLSDTAFSVLQSVAFNVFHDPLAIRYSLSIVMALPGPLMFWLFMRARGPYRALREVQQMIRAAFGQIPGMQGGLMHAIELKGMG